MSYVEEVAGVDDTATLGALLPHLFDEQVDVLEEKRLLLLERPLREGRGEDVSDAAVLCLIHDGDQGRLDLTGLGTIS